MGDLHETTEAISAYLTDLQNQVRAPSPPLASVIRVLAEPLQFLGLIEASQQGPQLLSDALPRWAGPGLESRTNEPLAFTRLHFIQHLLPNHLEFILDHITLDWLSALTTSQQSKLFDASFVPTLGSSRQQSSPGYNWASSVTVVSVQTLVGRLNHRFQENHSFMNQTILRLLRKLLTTYTLPDYHHGALFLSRTKPHRSSPGSTALSEWSVYWDSFVSKLYSIPTRISNVLGVTGQLGSRTDQELDPFQETVFFQRQAKQLQHLLESIPNKDVNKDEEEHDWWPRSCAVVITKYMRLGYGAILVHVITTTLWGVQDSSKTKGWLAALSSCSPGVVQLVLTALADHFQADRLDFGDNVYKSTNKGSTIQLDQILSPKEQLSRVHKAAQILVDLGFGAEHGDDKSSKSNSSGNNGMVAQVLIQGKVYSMGVLRTLVCVQSGWPRGVQAAEDSVLFKSFINVVSIWSDPLFVKHSSIEYQRYISFQLLLIMGYLHSTTLSDLGLGGQIGEGMSSWLDLQSFQQKTIALVIAEEYTKAIGSQANFDLNGSDPDIQFARSLLLLRDGTRPYDPVPDTVPLDKSQDTGNPDHGIDDTDGSTVLDDDNNEDDEEEDPDAIVPLTRTTVDSDSDRGSDSDDEDKDDDDDLKPYEMEYESDPDEDAGSTRKPKVAAPLYLRDLNRYLRASEDREKAEMGLDKATELIRRKAGSLELEENVEMLTTTLIEMQNTFELDEFFKKREDALVALVVTSPILTSGVLTYQFYEKKNSIGQRLNILTVLGLGARELAGFPATASTFTTGGLSPAPPSKAYGATAVRSVAKKPSTFDSITTDIAVERTRKFSQKSDIEARQSQPKANPFANVAPVVLAGLLGRWGGNRGAGKERGYDAMQRAPAMILKRFILTLGLIVYYAGNSPQLTLMTRELFRFILALRYHHPPATEIPSGGVKRGAPTSVADSISAMFDQATTLSAPLTSLKLPETSTSIKSGKSSSLSTLDSSYSYNLDLVEAILFNILILVTPNNSSLSDEILLSEFYPEILEIQNWTMELWDHPQDNQGKSRMYCAAVLQRCFELLKMA